MIWSAYSFAVGFGLGAGILGLFFGFCYMDNADLRRDLDSLRRWDRRCDKLENEWRARSPK